MIFKLVLGEQRWKEIIPGAGWQRGGRGLGGAPAGERYS